MIAHVALDTLMTAFFGGALLGASAALIGIFACLRRGTRPDRPTKGA